MDGGGTKTFRRTLTSQIRRLSTTEQKFVPIQAKPRIKADLKTKAASNNEAIDEEIIKITKCAEEEEIRLDGGDSISSAEEEVNGNGNDTRDSSPLTLTDDSGFGGCGLKLDCSARSSLSVSPVPPLTAPNPNRRSKTPVPADSPLLQKNNAACSPQLKKMKDFNRTMRRAKSFRALHHHRCSSETSTSSNEGEAVDAILAAEVTFSIGRTQFGRRGWKVAPFFDVGEDEIEFKALVAAGLVQRVLTNIKQLELTGHTVPEMMTIKVR